MSSDDEVALDAGMFEEPQDFLPVEPLERYAEYRRKVAGAFPLEIKLRLVGLSPLWGHLLWNAGIYTADLLDARSRELVVGKRILELGAAAALPSLICALNDASFIVSTDYPDPELVSNINHNFDNIVCSPEKYSVQGYIWGNDVTPLFCKPDEETITTQSKFDLVILSDVVFNHTEHRKLLKTCQETVKPDGRCLVVFTPHRPALLDKDLSFFTTCEEFGFKAERIDLVQMKPMFEEDEETAEVRARVYSYFLIPQPIKG